MPIISGSDKKRGQRYAKWGKTGEKFYYTARDKAGRLNAVEKAYKSAGVPIPPKIKRARIIGPQKPRARRTRRT